MIGRLLVALVVIFVFALLRKYLPAAPRGSASDKAIDELNLRFGSIHWPSSIAMVLIGVAIGLGGYKALVKLNDYFASAEGAAEFVLLPSRAIWAFLPGFAALVLPWEITIRIWSKFGNAQELTNYVAWSNAKAGFDCTRALRWIGAVILIPIALFTLPAIPMHATLQTGQMQIRDYATLTSRRYRYSEARHLFQVDGLRDRSGKFTARAEVVVDFADGRRWASADNRDFAPEVEDGLVEFLREKTGLSLQHEIAEGDLPPIAKK